MSNFGAVKRDERKHHEIINAERTHAFNIKLANRPHDRRSAEARARFERPAWHQVMMQKFNKEV